MTPACFTCMHACIIVYADTHLVVCIRVYTCMFMRAYGYTCLYIKRCTHMNVKEIECQQPLIASLACLRCQFHAHVIQRIVTLSFEIVLAQLCEKIRK